MMCVLSSSGSLKASSDLLLQELTDVDTLAESEEGANDLIQVLTSP